MSVVVRTLRVANCGASHLTCCRVLALYSPRLSLHRPLTGGCLSPQIRPAARAHWWFLDGLQRVVAARQHVMQISHGHGARVPHLLCVPATSGMHTPPACPRAVRLLWACPVSVFVSIRY